MYTGVCVGNTGDNPAKEGVRPPNGADHPASKRLILFDRAAGTDNLGWNGSGKTEDMTLRGKEMTMAKGKKTTEKATEEESTGQAATNPGNAAAEKEPGETPGTETVQQAKAAKLRDITDKLDSVPVGKLREITDEILSAINNFGKILPELFDMPDEWRTVSEGNFRENETEILQSVLKVAEEHPQYFGALAKKDKGQDPGELETDLLRQRIQRRDLYKQLARAFEPLAIRLNDTALYEGENSRSVALRIYSIAKSMAKHDDVLRSKLSQALDFYKEPARKAAKTRAAKKKAQKTEEEK